MQLTTKKDPTGSKNKEITTKLYQIKLSFVQKEKSKLAKEICREGIKEAANSQFIHVGFVNDLESFCEAHNKNKYANIILKKQTSTFFLFFALNSLV